ncbi:GIY-YIG nuclease family protein [Chloroflexota bacterium]
MFNTRKLKYTVAGMRRKNKNICGYWDCKKHIPNDDFLCAEHYESWSDGLIDRCPKCGRFKDIMYQLCLDCYFGRTVAPWEPPAVIPAQKQHYKVEYSDAWIDGHMRPDRLFVYILQFDNGDFYVGHTAELGKRFFEDTNQQTSSTAGGNPKLQYLEIVATKKAAELREDELKRLIDSNPSQIHLMIANFHKHMSELGLD